MTSTLFCRRFPKSFQLGLNQDTFIIFFPLKPGVLVANNVIVLLKIIMACVTFCKISGYTNWSIFSSSCLTYPLDRTFYLMGIEHNRNNLLNGLILNSSLKITLRHWSTVQFWCFKAKFNLAFMFLFDKSGVSWRVGDQIIFTSIFIFLPVLLFMKRGFNLDDQTICVLSLLCYHRSSCIFF